MPGGKIHRKQARRTAPVAAATAGALAWHQGNGFWKSMLAALCAGVGCGLVGQVIHNDLDLLESTANGLERALSFALWIMIIGYVVFRW